MFFSEQCSWWRLKETSTQLNMVLAIVIMAMVIVVMAIVVVIMVMVNESTMKLTRGWPVGEFPFDNMWAGWSGPRRCILVALLQWLTFIWDLLLRKKCPNYLQPPRPLSPQFGQLVDVEIQDLKVKWGLKILQYYGIYTMRRCPIEQLPMFLCEKTHISALVSSKTFFSTRTLFSLNTNWFY